MSMGKALRTIGSMKPMTRWIGNDKWQAVV